MTPFDKHTVQISDKELKEPQARAVLIKLVGTNEYKRVLKQFAEQRLGPERIGGFTKDQLKNLSQAEYEASRDRIQADQNRRADPKKPVYADLTITENNLATIQQKELAESLLGYSRYMQAQGLSGLEELSDKAYHQITNREYSPYQTRVGGGSSNSRGDLTKPNPNAIDK